MMEKEKEAQANNLNDIEVEKDSAGKTLEPHSEDTDNSVVSASGESGKSVRETLEHNIGDQTILQLDNEDACALFIKSDMYCNFEMPEYFDFSEALCSAGERIGDKSVDECLDGINPHDLKDINFDMVLNKDGKYAVRVLSLVNPYLYDLLVIALCDEHNWDAVRECFRAFACERIKCVSIPVVPKSVEKFHKSTTILHWWNKFEQQAVRNSLEYRYMFVSDITNCYGSIEIHSIADALARRGTSCETGDNEAMAADILRCLSIIRRGKNIGIPQGNAVSDMLAEIVLGYSDLMLREALEAQGITDGYEILRYRDDYKIFANDIDLLERISYTLQSVLERLNFRLNPGKTRISKSIITDSVKADKLAYIYNTPIFNKKGCDFDGIQKHLMYILMFGRDYPNSGQLKVLLDDMDKRIMAYMEEHKIRPVFVMPGMSEESILSNYYGTIIEDITAIAAVVTQIAIENSSSTQYALKVLSRVLVTVRSQEEKDRIIEKVVKRLGSMPNSEYVKIWLQNLAIRADYQGDCDFGTNALCRLVSGEVDHLWNNDFLPAELTDGFDATIVVDANVLGNGSHVITFKSRNPYAFLEEIDWENLDTDTMPEGRRKDAGRIITIYRPMKKCRATITF